MATLLPEAVIPRGYHITQMWDGEAFRAHSPPTLSMLGSLRFGAEACDAQRVFLGNRGQ